jgi:hypothetical protein
MQISSIIMHCVGKITKSCNCLLRVRKEREEKRERERERERRGKREEMNVMSQLHRSFT